MEHNSDFSLQHTSLRYGNLDILKAVCAFLVILIHAPFRNELGVYAKAISRTAVPVFFLISGFLFEEKFPNVNPKKQFIKMLKLILQANVLFFIWDLLYYHYYLHEISFSDLLLCVTGGSNWLQKWSEFLLFHTSLLYKVYHLWYLNAALYAWLIFYAVQHFWGNSGRKVLYIITPLLLVYATANSNYATVLFDSFTAHKTRNFLFCGLPYFCIGSWLQQNQSRVESVVSDKSCLAGLLFFGALVCFEEKLLSVIRAGGTADYYFSTPFLAFFLFVLFMKLPEVSAHTGFGALLAYIGKYHSARIYLLHPILQVLTPQFISLVHLQKFYYQYNLIPFFVFFETLLVSLLLHWLFLVKRKLTA